MKKHTLTMSLALLSAAILGGCQEQGSTPVGPEALGPQFHHGKGSHANGGGNDDGSETRADAMVTLKGGMIALDQPVGVQTDNDKKLALNSDGTTVTKIVLTVTRDAGLTPKDFDECVADTDDTTKKQDLLAKLSENIFRDRWFNMVVDKPNLGGASAKHRVASTWQEDQEGLFSLNVGTSALLPHLSATVSAASDPNNPNTTTYTFIGGSVTIKDRTGKVRDHVSLACPNQDIVEVTVVLP